MIVSDSIRYIGVNDTTLDLFESQYPVPNGVSYNSYLIIDEKIAVMDTVDARGTENWLENLQRELNGRAPDYLVVHHMEPDHAANIDRLVRMYPAMRVVGNCKTFPLIGQFFDIDLSDRQLIVKEGETLCLGKHTLQFVMAPMVHWPEVMVSFEQTEKVLFSADAFGKFGAIGTQEDWTCEARRYYFNIVGKYGMPVQTLLKKAAALEIQTICPLHGPVLKENLGFYLGKYQTWSAYQPEDSGVLVAYASIHGHTAEAAKKFADMLRKKGIEKVVVADLSRDMMSEAVEDAFRYDRLALFAASYDAGVFPAMEEFLLHLKSKAYQKRRVCIVENGSWAPSAGKTMRALLEGMKEIEIIEPVVTIRSALKPDTEAKLDTLAEAMR